MPSYIPEYVYGFKGWDERNQPTYGLMPWPEHLKPRKPAPLPDIDLKRLFNEAPAVPQLVEAGGVFFLSLAPNDRASIAYTVERLINMLDAMDGDESLEAAGDDEPSLGWTGNGPSAIFADSGDDREVDNSDYEDGGDYEPMLGAPERHPWSQESVWGRSGELRRQYGPSQEQWASGATEAVYDDCEDVSEDEGAQDDREFSLGWQDEGAQDTLAGHFGDGDLEANLGTTEEFDQVRRLEREDGLMTGLDEPDLGWAESFGKGIVGPQNCLAAHGARP